MIWCYFFCFNKIFVVFQDEWLGIKRLFFFWKMNKSKISKSVIKKDHRLTVFWDRSPAENRTRIKSLGNSHSIR